MVTKVFWFAQIFLGVTQFLKLFDQNWPSIQQLKKLGCCPNFFRAMPEKFG
jgi:hypothetical protein